MNEIHPTAIIDDRVKIGKGNKILPYSIINGPTEIGDNNIIGPHVVIGSPGQDTRNLHYDSTNAFIQIGDRNIIREFCAIQKPCYTDITRLRNDIFLMQSVHIPHDAQLSDQVVITPMCVLGGITTVLKGANIGMGATVNQYCVIGQYSIVATGAPVMKNVKPFSRFIPNKNITVNDYAIKKFGYEEYRSEIEAYVFDNVIPESPPLHHMIDEFSEKHKQSKRDVYS